MKKAEPDQSGPVFDVFTIIPREGAIGVSFPAQHPRLVNRRK